MKVALVHDWLTGMRGGERVLERVARCFPGADIHTLVWRRGSVSAELERHPIHTSFLDRLPSADTRYRWFLPLFPRAVESLDLSAYVRRTCSRLRRWDRATAGRPTHLVSISRHVAERVRRHWSRESQVVYPHVDVGRFSPWNGERSYYLLAGAFAPYKRLDLALAAFARLHRPLLVVGGGQEEARLHAAAPRGTEFRAGVSDDELARLIAGARAFIFPGEEDFGIMPLEAMASGTPVIAYGRGGALETVGRGATADALERIAAGGVARVPGGMLFGTQTADAIAGAVAAFEKETFEPSALAALARPFSGERFDAEIRGVFASAGIPVDGA